MNVDHDDVLANRIPQEAPLDAIRGVLRLLVGIMDAGTYVTPATSQLRLTELLHAAPDAHTFKNKFHELVKADDAIKFLVDAKIIARLERIGNEPYRYHILVPIEEGERRRCVAYVDLCVQGADEGSVPFNQRFYSGLPDDPNELRHGFADVGMCRYCGAAVIWGNTQNGKRIPLDFDAVRVDMPEDEPRKYFFTRLRYHDSQEQRNLVTTPGNAWASTCHLDTCVSPHNPYRSKPVQVSEEARMLAELLHPGTDQKPSEPLKWFQSIWALAVGEENATSAVPVAVKGSTLVIATRSKIWSQQLEFLAAKIITKLNAVAEESAIQNYRPIERIKLRVERNRFFK